MPTKLPVVRPGYKIDPKTGKPYKEPGITTAASGKTTKIKLTPPLTPRPTPSSAQPRSGGYTYPVEDLMKDKQAAPPLTPRPTGGFGGQATVRSAPPLTPQVVPPNLNGGGISGGGGSGGSLMMAQATNPAGPSAPLPVGTGNTGGANTSGLTDPLHGFAKQFDPALLPYIYAQPELILSALMQKQKMDPFGQQAGLFTAATPYADALNAIMPLAWGASGQPDPSSPINWLAGMMQEGLTPGGRAIDFGDVLTQLGRVDPGNNQDVLGAMLAGVGMDPLDQISKLKQIVLGGAQGGLAPQFQSAVQNMLNAAATQYMGNFTTGKTTDSFLNNVFGSGGIFAPGANFR